MQNKSKTDPSVEDLKAGLKEYNDILTKLKTIDEIKKFPAQFDDASFVKMGKAEKSAYLQDKVKEACGSDAYEYIDKLIKLTHQSYDQFKALRSGQHNTHRYITEQACALLKFDQVMGAKLLKYCTYPDEPKSDMCDLIFEGHFYGKTNSGEPGNFLINLYPKILRALEAFKKILHGRDEDIREHAVANFARHYVNRLSDGSEAHKYFCFGVAAHFLQDLTAPHHAGNYPAVPYVDHYFFEKYASQYVYDRPQFVISRSAYDNFKSNLQSGLSRPELFALEINDMAKPYIVNIETDFHRKLASNEKIDASFIDAEVDNFNNYLVSRNNQKWEKAIDGAVLLAVYATAFLFESFGKEAGV